MPGNRPFALAAADTGLSCEAFHKIATAVSKKQRRSEKVACATAGSIARLVEIRQRALRRGRLRAALIGIAV
jgi:hypothetical protein